MDTQHDGLFGPGSITWRVHAEPILWVGGLRALYLQALHPVGVAGVLRHSDFTADPWGRLGRTANYVGIVTFGSMADVDAVGQRVRGLHGTIAGTDPESGLTYRASDPELLRWVHCCEVESFVATYQRAGGGLTPDEIDQYFTEQRRAAAVVGLKPSFVPGTAAEMAAYFELMRPALHVDSRTRRIARHILLPPMPLWVKTLTPAAPGWASMSALAFASLPRWARRMYGLPGLPTTDLATSVGLRSLRSALNVAQHVAPPRYREGPHAREAKTRLAS